ncbi:hypothetical protein [Acetobacter oeni]|uniref:Uncharacterized protein n=1 Tax=Acetobacter oeni TaxID=304077 RepID=A0A511XJG5_9PROT|nr:hypothetical protein [Acetobacter oeni]MBB3883303.1 hypothetical protein [Acetobacter oeni]NHO19529.1 hypothetical protein [Acetobacter oeni]GBR00895.1 hypothetical protein AA21952_0255 [Acetobacter oeni LMG 21952]GEN63084.1 hypothetical protein AOE01nite_13080 [Acetobacter oeni]
MRNGTNQNNALLEVLIRINGGRTMQVNTFSFIGALVMLGFANLLSQFVLKVNLSYLIPWLVGAAAIWCFGPALILWVCTGSPTGRR